MKGTSVLALGLILWICAAMQQSLAERLGVLGFRPDFLLVAVACFSMFFTRAGGALVGFVAGAIYGALDMANLTVFVISRTCAGFACAWANDLRVKEGPLVASISTALTTVFARFIYMFLAPPAFLMPFVGDTIRTAVYNGVLAVPMYLLVKRIMGPPR